MDTASVMDSLLARTGLSVAEFMARIDGTYSTWYKWRDGTNRIGRANQLRIEREFGVRLKRNTEGEIVGLDFGLTTPDIRDTVPTVESEDLEAGRAPTGLSEDQMIEMYERVAREAGLPRWEDLPDDVRLRLKQTILLYDKAVQSMRLRMEAGIIQHLQEVRR